MFTVEIKDKSTDKLLKTQGLHLPVQLLLFAVQENGTEIHPYENTEASRPSQICIF